MGSVSHTAEGSLYGVRWFCTYQEASLVEELRGEKAALSYQEEITSQSGWMGNKLNLNKQPTSVLSSKLCVLSKIEPLVKSFRLSFIQ